MSVQTSYPNTVTSRPLTEQDIEEITPVLAKAVNDYLQGEGAPLVAQIQVLNKQIVYAREQQAEAKQEIIEAREMQARARTLQVLAREKQAQGREKQAQGQAMQDRGQAMQDRGQAMQIEAREKQAQGRQMIEQGLQGLQHVATERRNILTTMFYGIFHGKTALSIEVINSLFQTYLSDGSLTIEKSSEGKSFAKINSMRAVTAYLDKDPTITRCNFLGFKGEVYDVPTLAEYLAKSSCTITAIGMNNGISCEAKASLAQAIATRKGALKVQYKD